MYLFAEVVFYSGQREKLPKAGYRPDVVFNRLKEYWGITFVELVIDSFDSPTPAILKFTFQECHYHEIDVGERFTIMEGSRQVGEGQVIAIEKNECF